MSNSWVSSQIRARVNFGFNWKFFKGDIPGAEDITFNDADWKSINIPHDWSIEGPFSKDNPSGRSGGYLPGGIGWYRKSFDLFQKYRGKKIFIEFDGVYMNSDVWINGHHLGNHPYGYTSFHYDVTPYLKYGDSKNILAVRVDNSKQPNSRWYSGSGIYRHVWLLITDKLHVDHWGTFVTTPEVSKESATVEIKTRIKNETNVCKQVDLITTIIDKDNKVVKTIDTTQEIPQNGEYEFIQRAKIKSPNLWSPDSPYLYKVYSTVKDEKKTVDNYETPLGIREFHFDANRGFFLNGENMKIKGVCLHHDCGCLGAACHERAIERKIEILKEIGCNAIRTSHNPPAPELLDYCDRYGLLVMDEAFDEWKKGKTEYGYHKYFEEGADKDLKSMIYRDRNHPSIIMWSVGNEIPEQSSPEGVKILRKLVKLVHEEDPTRPVTSACNNIKAANETGFADLLDVVGYNYQERFYEEDHKNYPDRKIIGSETVDYPLSVWLANEKKDYVACSYELHTAGKPAKIVLTPDRDNILANSRDLSYVEVSVVDKDGNIVPDANNLITFDVSGEGKIIGVGSGDQQSHEDYKSNKRKVYNGKCLLVVQSRNKSGQIRIMATSPGLISSSISLITIRKKK